MREGEREAKRGRKEREEEINGQVSARNRETKGVEQREKCM